MDSGIDLSRISFLRLGRNCLGLALCFSLLTSCYVFNKDSAKGSKKGATAALLGESLGPRASGIDEAALQDVYAVTTTHAPAGVRPDPDLFVRQLLLQYRDQGSLVAREIGRVESFRMLLGGANENFTIVPQETYDATSLLAELKVAEEVCQSLVAPDARLHPGWSTILPAAASEVDTNVRFLAQRLLGVASTTIDEDNINSLKEILASAQGATLDNQDYIPVCATLIIDAEALLL